MFNLKKTKLTFKISAILLAGVAVYLTFINFQPLELLPSQNSTNKVNTIPQSENQLRHPQQRAPSENPTIVRLVKKYQDQGIKSKQMTIIKYKNSYLFCLNSIEEPRCAITFDNGQPLSGIIVPKPKLIQNKKLEARLNQLKRFYEQQTRR